MASNAVDHSEDVQQNLKDLASELVEQLHQVIDDTDYEKALVIPNEETTDGAIYNSGSPEYEELLDAGEHLTDEYKKEYLESVKA